MRVVQIEWFKAPHYVLFPLSRFAYIDDDSAYEKWNNLQTKDISWWNKLISSIKKWTLETVLNLILF